MINGIIVQNNPLKYIDPKGLRQRSNRVGSFSDGGNDYTYDYTPNPNVSLTRGNQEVPGSSNNSLSLTSNNVEVPSLANAPEWIDKGRNVSNSSGLANKIIKEAVGFIPVVGSGIESYNNFKDGKYVQGSIYAGLAVAEAFPGLVALSKGAKYAPKIVSSVAKFLKGSKGTDELVDVYRVYSGKAKPNGWSWTDVNPGTVKNFRDSAGLPDVNTGRFIIEGTVKKSDIIKTREALELDGNKGGLMELIINPKNVIKKRVSGVNPAF